VGGHHPARQDVEARRQARIDAGRTGGLESGRVRRPEANREALSEAGRKAARKQGASQRAEQDANPVPFSPVDPSPDTRPAPDRARETDDLEELLEAIEARGVRVNRGNGHVDMLRDLVGAHGLSKVLQTFRAMTGPIANVGNVAKYIDDELRERPATKARIDHDETRGDRERAARTDRIRRQRVERYSSTGIWDPAWGPTPDELPAAWNA
jgi:hypothetical protein